MSGPAAKEPCGGGQFVHPTPSQEHRVCSRPAHQSPILCSLPDVIDRIQSDEAPPVDGDREGSNFYSTAHHSFIFDESDADMASSVGYSEASSPPESIMGEHSEPALRRKATAQKRRVWPKVMQQVREHLSCFTQVPAVKSSTQPKSDS